MIKFWSWTKKIFYNTIKSLYLITVGWLVLVGKILYTNIKKWINGSK